MEITFDKTLHQYRVNSEIVGISVTQLLRKHGLAPNYNGVSAEVLQNAADRGTDIHKDLELLITHENYDPFTKEGEAFKKYIDEFIDCATAEQVLAYKYETMWIAGTADIIGYFKKADKGCFVGDHKTTSSINREYVSWQVSILDYMLRKLGAEQVNGKSFKGWKGANEFLCFHYGKDGDLQVIKLTKVADEEIERLFECEYKGEIYQRKELAVDDEIKNNMINITRAINSYEKTMKKLKAQQDKYKQIIMDCMEKQGIKKVENEYFTITYVYPKDSVRVDSAKLKKDYPQVYANCTMASHTGAQLRITIKGEEDGEQD